MLNTAIIMGRLTSDPELKTTPSGHSVTSFTVAVDRNTKDKQTDFIPVVAWRERADFITRYFHKGEMIVVQGSIQIRSYDDRNGNKRTIAEIIAENVSFCGNKEKNKDETEKAENEQISADFENVADDDGLPF